MLRQLLLAWESTWRGTWSWNTGFVQALIDLPCLYFSSKSSVSGWLDWESCRAFVAGSRPSQPCQNVHVLPPGRTVSDIYPLQQNGQSGADRTGRRNMGLLWHGGAIACLCFECLISGLVEAWENWRDSCQGELQIWRLSYWFIRTESRCGIVAKRASKLQIRKSLVQILPWAWT